MMTVARDDSVCREERQSLARPMAESIEALKAYRRPRLDDVMKIMAARRNACRYN